MTTFKKGDRVRLSPSSEWGDPNAEFCPEEFGTVVAAPFAHDGIYYAVQLDPQYYDLLEKDYGVRTVPKDQLSLAGPAEEDPLVRQ